ncbi:hypothetical protein [Streptomyces sp. NPDC020607]|uniref:hypothetical protein n=1 Tax=Streptomyces sp. NPDC020607 TaxID=3365082 RepID=UPI003794F279
MATEQNLVASRTAHPVPVVFSAGAAIGVLGGMIGLGGAEFRLPVLIGLFGFAALSAVIVNKAMSLVVVLVALPARLRSICWQGACLGPGPGRRGPCGCVLRPSTRCWPP